MLKTTPQQLLAKTTRTLTLVFHYSTVIPLLMMSPNPALPVDVIIFRRHNKAMRNLCLKACGPNQIEPTELQTYHR